MPINRGSRGRRASVQGRGRVPATQAAQQRRNAQALASDFPVLYPIELDSPTRRFTVKKAGLLQTLGITEEELGGITTITSTDGSVTVLSSANGKEVDLSTGAGGGGREQLVWINF
ncbi:MAG: hypothetical protein B7733_06355 [Myxococcales bacterium FL481]|nr:MAG: hypothetical protein B7733_06355 [Myxococcales bacterium FL481]